MPLLATVELLAQIYFAVHAAQTGKDRYWIFLIIFFPGLGCLIYFFSEYLPELQRSARIRRAAAGADRLVNPQKRIRYLEDQVKITPSISNKKALAEGYVNAGLFDKAIFLYESCLQGIHQDDVPLLEGLCCAQFFKGDYPEAKNRLEQLMRLRNERRGDEFDLLLARTLEEMGDTAGALDAYAVLVKAFGGEEARCRYALLLEKTGRQAEARKVFQEILENVRLSPKFYQASQKQWVKIARQHV